MLFFEDIARELIDTPPHADFRAILKLRHTVEVIVEVYKARFGKPPEEVRDCLRGLVYQEQTDAVLRFVATCERYTELEPGLKCLLRSQWESEPRT